MSNIISPKPFQIEYTADGSPTMRVRGQEPMHSLSGAFAETRSVYEPAIDFALPEGGGSLLSVGLGIGYNEILAAAKSLLLNKPLSLESMEAESILRSAFESWLRGKGSTYAPVYDGILAMTAETFSLPFDELFTYLKNHLLSGQFRLLGPLTPRSRPSFGVHGILFDAYSSQTNPELWSQEFLESVIEQWSQRPCAFATYASTGKLKRALQNQGYEFCKKKGFGTKREATFAIQRD